MDIKAFTQKIKNYALHESRFDLVGISSANLPKLHADAIHSWVEQGFAGSMHYMSRPEPKRYDPQSILPGARTVISLAVNYYHPEDPKPQTGRAGKVAKYAYGMDYHKILEKKLKQLAEFIKQNAFAPTQIKYYVDTGPILEKAFAREAGLGFFGKNTNLITKKYGSWIFLASLITDIELSYDEAHTGSCGSCKICIDACPTKALLGNYTMDARRCISYLTIESRQDHPEALKPGIGEWVFGCDICQDVCPYNHKANTTTHDKLYPSQIAGTWLKLDEIKNCPDDEAFARIFHGSPIKRTKLSGLLRNVKTVSDNEEPSEKNSLSR